MIDVVLLAKFRRRAPLIATQEHLDRAMFLFPVEHHDEIAAQIQPLLRTPLIARKVEALPELIPQNPEAPTLHEETAQRLNSMAAQIEQLKTEQQPAKEQIELLTGQVEGYVATLAALQADRDSLHETLVERDATIARLTMEVSISRGDR